jgi:hypothetical protein
MKWEKKARKFPNFYETPRLIRRKSRPSSELEKTQSTSWRPVSLRCILILSAKLQLGQFSPISLLPSGLLPQTLYAFINSPTRASWLAYRKGYELIWYSIYFLFFFRNTLRHEKKSHMRCRLRPLLPLSNLHWNVDCYSVKKFPVLELQDWS